MDLSPGAALFHRRSVRGFALLGSAAALALSLVVLEAWLFVHLGWPNREPPHDPEYGINYSCNQAEYLLLEDPAKGAAGYVSDDRPGRVQWCAETLDTLLSQLGANYLRLSVEWSQAEPARGVYDFALIDALLETAQRNGARVLLSVGMKAQRHPEYYVPGWALESADPANTGESTEVSHDPGLRAAALAFIEAAVVHLQAHPAIDSWLADNEPYLASPRAHNWTLGRDFVREEIATIRANDPLGRPVVVNHAELSASTGAGAGRPRTPTSPARASTRSATTK